MKMQIESWVRRICIAQNIEIYFEKANLAPLTIMTESLVMCGQV